MEDSDTKRVSQVWSLCCLLPGAGPAWKESTYLSMQSRGIIKLWSFRGREEEKNTHKCAGLCFSWTFKIIFSPTHRSKWYHIWERSQVDGNDLWGEGEEEGSRHLLLCLPCSPSPFSETEHTNERAGKKSSVWVQPKASGGFKSILRPVGFFVSVWWIRGADSATPWSPRAPTLQEASFLPEAPMKWFSTHFSRLKWKRKG